MANTSAIWPASLAAHTTDHLSIFGLRAAEQEPYQKKKKKREREKLFLVVKNMKDSSGDNGSLQKKNKIERTTYGTKFPPKKEREREKKRGDRKAE